jgi:hypothetical protein
MHWRSDRFGVSLDTGRGEGYPFGVVNYTTHPHSAPYERLCQLVAQEAGTVKLSRQPDTWAIQATLPPTATDLGWRGAALLFADIAELDAQARHLLRWLESTRPNVRGQGEDPIKTNKERRTV